MVWYKTELFPGQASPTAAAATIMRRFYMHLCKQTQEGAKEDEYVAMNNGSTKKSSEDSSVHLRSYRSHNYYGVVLYKLI